MAQPDADLALWGADQQRHSFVPLRLHDELQLAQHLQPAHTHRHVHTVHTHTHTETRTHTHAHTHSTGSDLHIHVTCVCVYLCKFYVSRFMFYVYMGQIFTSIALI